MQIKKIFDNQEEVTREKFFFGQNSYGNKMYDRSMYFPFLPYPNRQINVFKKNANKKKQKNIRVCNGLCDPVNLLLSIISSFIK